MAQWSSRGNIRCKKLLTLANFIAKYPDELEADFQQYYNIDLSRVLSVNDAGYTSTHIACLAKQLPTTSRTFIALNPDYAWSIDTAIEADIANSLRIIVHSFQKGSKKPDFILPPSIQKKQDMKKIKSTVMTRDEFDRILNMKRGD